MPTYEFRCPDGHDFEVRSSISGKPDAPPCPFEVEDYPRPDLCLSRHAQDEFVCPDCPSEKDICGKPGKQIFLTVPVIWIPGVTHERVFDYPGSKAQKAGYVHTHGDKPATRVQSGYGGTTSTSFKHHDEVADWVIPDKTKSTIPG